MGNSTDRNTDIDSALDLLIGDTPTDSAGKGNDPSVAKEKKSDSPMRSHSQVNPPKPDRIEKRQSTESSRKRPKARTGRPPGVRTGVRRLKDKTSLALDLELMDRYRKQSWKEECQLGELVERALRDYAADRWGWNSNMKQHRAE